MDQTSPSTQTDDAADQEPEQGSPESHASAGEQDHSHEGFEVQVNTDDPGTAKVDFQVSAEEFKKAYSQGLKKAGSSLRMKGFRPGKIPAAIVERSHGPAVAHDVAMHFCEHALQTAVREHDLRPAMRPRIDPETMKAEPGQAFEGSFELLLRPEVELGKYRGMAVDGQSVEVSDEDVSAAIEDLQRQNSRPEAAGEEGLPAEGMAICSISFLKADEDETIMEREKIRLAPKSPPPGVDPDAFEQALTGSNEGDEHEFPVTFPDDFPVEEARGTPGRCRVQVTKAYQIVPPSTEDMCKILQVDDEEAIQATVRERMEAGRKDQEASRIESLLINQLIDDHPLEFPAPLVDGHVQNRLDEIRKDLRSKELPEEEVESQVAEETERVTAEAIRALRAIYLIEEIAKVEDLQVSSEDIQGEFNDIAARNGVDLDSVRDYYQKNGLLQQMGMELLEKHVRTLLRESAEISSAS